MATLSEHRTWAPAVLGARVSAGRIRGTSARTRAPATGAGPGSRLGRTLESDGAGVPGLRKFGYTSHCGQWLLLGKVRGGCWERDVPRGLLALPVELIFFYENNLMFSGTCTCKK